MVRQARASGQEAARPGRRRAVQRMRVAVLRYPRGRARRRLALRVYSPTSYSPTSLIRITLLQEIGIDSSGGFSNHRLASSWPSCLAIAGVVELPDVEGHDWQ